MKKFFSIICIFALGIAFAWNGGATLVVAQEKVENSLTRIENALERLDTDVVGELNKQKADYERRLNTETDEKKIERLQSLISATEKLLQDYKGQTQKGEKNPVKTGVLGENQVGRIAEPTYIPKDADWFFYENAVSAIVAYFYAHEYYLSAELLTHARYNRDYGSVYSPINVDPLESSKAYTTICESEELYGASEFAKAGNVSDLDLFYAIHNFRYVKFHEGNVVTVYDNYDFVFDGQFDFIDDIPIKVMYMAQEKGVIVPFNVVIEKRFDGDLAERTNENYPLISYVNGEYHIYKDGCACECLSNHIEGNRIGEAHVDGDVNGFCDRCAKVLSDDVPLPEQPSTEKDGFEEFVDGAKETFNDVKDTVTGFIAEKTTGCSGSLSASVGCVSAFGLCACLLLKKKKHNAQEKGIE